VAGRPDFSRHGHIQYSTSRFCAQQKTHQEEKSVFQVLVGLNTAILGPLVIDGARRVKERHIAIPARTQIDLFQLQFVSGI